MHSDPEKAQKIKGKVKAALFYPTTVLIIAMAILWALLVFIVPRFQQVFEGLLKSGVPILQALSIVIAMFLPIVYVIDNFTGNGSPQNGME